MQNEQKKRIEYVEIRKHAIALRLHSILARIQYSDAFELHNFIAIL